MYDVDVHNQPHGNFGKSGVRGCRVNAAASFTPMSGLRIHLTGEQVCMYSKESTRIGRRRLNVPEDRKLTCWQCQLPDTAPRRFLGPCSDLPHKKQKFFFPSPTTIMLPIDGIFAERMTTDDNGQNKSFLQTLWTCKLERSHTQTDYRHIAIK